MTDETKRIRLQRAALAGTIALIAVYAGYRAWRTGDVGTYWNELRPSAGTSPSPSISAGPGVVAVPQPVPAGDAAAVLFRINERRAGSVVLDADPVLMREAQEHAADMARQGYFDHTAPDGTTFQHRMAASGYPAIALAENIGLVSGNDATVIVGLWAESPAHRDNMLNPTYAAAGIGIARGVWQGHPALYIVAIFSGPR